MPLEHLWAGWRGTYVRAATEAERDGAPSDGDGCVFCRLAASGEPAADNGVVWRGASTFAALNAYPYASGHLLVMPLRHLETLEELDGAESAELWSTVLAAARAVTA